MLPFVSAAIAAPSPVRASDLRFDAFVRPVEGVLDRPGREPSAPFPNWDPPPEADRHFVSRLAWLNDSPDNDLVDGFPGEGWEVDEPGDGPTPEDVAMYRCEVYDQHAGCGCPADEHHEHDHWFAEKYGREIHEGEMAECGYSPYGIRLSPAVAIDGYAGGDWR